jgi:hypothetical protein
MDEQLARAETTFTHEQILQRFKKLFGRDMTPEERRAFFLLPDELDDVA